jgi:serine/threonine protein kinase
VPAGRSTGKVDPGAAFDDTPTLMPGSPIRDDDAATLLPGFAVSDQELTHNGGLEASSGPVDTGPLVTGQSFGPRYHIIRPLGVGGMGAVYQAWDAELGVAVAIKVIRPEVMADAAAAKDVERRFKQELLLARQVTHRNVVRIHDLGEIQGIKYITMSYGRRGPGDSPEQEGQVPVPKVLRIARAVVAGLVAAHKAGVVHRDLKPANIMIDAEDEAVIMDFGIARSTGGAATMGCSRAPADSREPGAGSGRPHRRGHHRRNGRVWRPSRPGRTGRSTGRRLCPGLILPTCFSDGAAAS